MKLAQRPTKKTGPKAAKFKSPAGVKDHRGKHQDNHNIVDQHGDKTRKHPDRVTKTATFPFDNFRETSAKNQARQTFQNTLR